VGQFRENRLTLPDSIEATAVTVEQNGDRQTFRLINISSFGCRISPMEGKGQLYMNQILNELRINIDGQTVFTGTGYVVNEMGTEETPSYGIAVQGFGIDLDRVRAILETREKVGNLSATKTIMALVDLVRPDFKIQCAHLNVLFQDLRMRLVEEEAKIKSSHFSQSYREKLEIQAIDMAMSLYQQEIHNLFEAFQGIVDQLNPDEKIVHKRFFRVTIHPLLLSSPFINRAYSKPLGYAGDFGLMVMFYEYKDLGGDLFDKFMHRFACNEPAALANRNRVEHLAERLHLEYERFVAAHPVGTSFKVTSVACGPAKEVELFLSRCQVRASHPIQVVLVDQEPKALEHAQARLRKLNLPHGSFKLTLLNEDVVLGIVKRRPFCQYLSQSQFIISAGLFDYLSDRVSEKLLSGFYELLADGGQILVGNVSSSNPDKFSMEFVMEWQLILRNSDQLIQLCPPEWKSKDQVKVESEILGLNLFLEIKKEG